MFGDIVHFQKLDLGLMPLSAVTDCTKTENGATVANDGVASSVWPGTAVPASACRAVVGGFGGIDSTPAARLGPQFLLRVV